MENVEINLLSDAGAVGRLIISRLPSAFEGPELVDGDVVLREGRVFRYQLELQEKLVDLQPAELFNADDDARRTGRLLPGESVGFVLVEATARSGTVYRGAFEIRSAKLSDEAAFSKMLADLAALSVESLHQGFAPAAGKWASSPVQTPTLLYQQFAVLDSLLSGRELQWALLHVLQQPDSAWETVSEPRQAGRPLRGSSRLTRQISMPGARVVTPGGVLPSLPAALLAQRTESTRDTAANRFVRFVLERWQSLARDVVRNVEGLQGAPMRRGLRRAEAVESSLDALLGNPLFREVERLSHYPSDNPVLRRREGYRQIAVAAALVEGSLGLELGLDDPFLVSRRSVATLYEYWTFAQLALAVAAACGATDVAAQLFKPKKDGMSLVLRAGASSRLKFSTRINNDLVQVDLFFNNEFRRESWTRPMRPDASLLVRAQGREEMWLHFDAKFRVDWARPFDTGDPGDEEDAERTGVSKRTDLLKMHAYRDAIRGSAGSYVLFPGSDVAAFQLDSLELLPGLGAFPLRPDHAEGDVARLEQFVVGALRHAVSAGTRRGRAAYWFAKSYSGSGTSAPEARPPIGELPPADTPVLLGYVRSDEQWDWIGNVGLYNVRAGSRVGAVPSSDLLLDAPLLVLYGKKGGKDQVKLYRRDGTWEGVTAVKLNRLGYKNPRGEAYMVAAVAPVDSPSWLSLVNPQKLIPSGMRFGEPFSTSWLDLVLSVEDEPG